ncbi:hypothetical protein [Rhodospirillum centenum]|uniref:Uncharacterized protein n=1 Tax=Rhodospirillum centenum (strain ATCC 51521 / SW) TaxID=414684 RepID=B6ISY2_RHOCS|nr:hypothetical protein [Rhodospirillum centenum]ACI98653.1 hypothetical protein RC1_1242 [Rhodospirillum centenum SW]
MDHDRRLGDRILHALDLALDQNECEIADLLAYALELSLTRFGGPEAVEKRGLPPGLEGALERLGALRHRACAA